MEVTSRTISSNCCSMSLRFSTPPISGSSIEPPVVLVPHVDAPTPSARDVRCRVLQRQNKCGTKRIMANSLRNAEIVFRTDMRE